jgi:hypothetical protein
VTPRSTCETRKIDWDVERESQDVIEQQNFEAYKIDEVAPERFLKKIPSE